MSRFADPVQARHRSSMGATRHFLFWMAAVLAIGVLVRLPFLPRLGHWYDTNAYRVWMGAIQDYGLAAVLERTDTDYVGYHYILWALGKGYENAPPRRGCAARSCCCG